MPVCVVGAEEAAPIFAHISLLQKLTGLLYFPLTPTFPHFGPLGMLGYLPAKFRIRFLEPIDFDDDGLDRGQVAWCRRSPTRSARRIQENLFEMLEERESVWFG